VTAIIIDLLARDSCDFALSFQKTACATSTIEKASKAVVDGLVSAFCGGEPALV
jgi:hypothetical protein